MFEFKSYVIDADFLVDYDLKEKKLDDNDNKLKCIPKRGSNQTPYQKIEFEIRKDAGFWPPITAPTNHDTHTPANTNQNVVIEKSLNRSNSNRSHRANRNNEYEMTTEKVTIVPNENQTEELNVKFTKI